MRWNIQPLFPFSPWREPRPRHFAGYPFGVSRKKASTVFYNTAFSKMCQTKGIQYKDTRATIPEKSPEHYCRLAVRRQNVWLRDWGPSWGQRVSRSATGGFGGRLSPCGPMGTDSAASLRKRGKASPPAGRCAGRRFGMCGKAVPRLEPPPPTLSIYQQHVFIYYMKSEGMIPYFFSLR